MPLRTVVQIEGSISTVLATVDPVNSTLLPSESDMRLTIDELYTVPKLARVDTYLARFSEV